VNVAGNEGIREFLKSKHSRDRDASAFPAPGGTGKMNMAPALGGFGGFGGFGAFGSFGFAGRMVRRAMTGRYRPAHIAAGTSPPNATTVPIPIPSAPSASQPAQAHSPPQSSMYAQPQAQRLAGSRLRAPFSPPISLSLPF